MKMFYYLCLMDCITYAHWNIITDTNQINFRIKIHVNAEIQLIIKNILIEISKQKAIIKDDVDENENKIKGIKDKINEQLKISR